MDIMQIAPIVLSFLSGTVIEPMAEYIKSKIPDGSPLKNLGIVAILNVIVIVGLTFIFQSSLDINQISLLAFGTGASSIATHTYKKTRKK